MTDNRGLVVAATALPASFLFERARVTRDVLYARFGTSREKLGAVGAFPEVWDKVRLQPELRTAASPTEEDEAPTDTPRRSAISTEA